jgi:preprotein translocase subunit SecE
MEGKSKGAAVALQEKQASEALSSLASLKGELKKVSWTAKGELAFSTKVVVGATFLFGLGIYLADLVIKGTLGVLGFLFRLIFG